jgi:hypothetical protein
LAVSEPFVQAIVNYSNLPEQRTNLLSCVNSIPTVFELASDFESPVVYVFDGIHFQSLFNIRQASLIQTDPVLELMWLYNIGNYSLNSLEQETFLLRHLVALYKSVLLSTPSVTAELGRFLRNHLFQSCLLLNTFVLNPYQDKTLVIEKGNTIDNGSVRSSSVLDSTLSIPDLLNNTHSTLVVALYEWSHERSAVIGNAIVSVSLRLDNNAETNSATEQVDQDQRNQEDEAVVDDDAQDEYEPYVAPQPQYVRFDLSQLQEWARQNVFPDLAQPHTYEFSSNTNGGFDSATLDTPIILSLPLSEYDHLFHNSVCTDYATLDSDSTARYLSLNNNNNNNTAEEEDEHRWVVFLPPDESNQNNAVCITRSHLLQLLQDPTAVNLPCLRNGQADPAYPFVRLSVPQNVYVPASDLLSILMHAQFQARMLQLLRTEEILPATYSVDAIINNRHVSSDHCQEGSGKRVYRLASYLINSSVLDTDHFHQFYDQEYVRESVCRMHLDSQSHIWIPGQYRRNNPRQGECVLRPDSRRMTRAETLRRRQRENEEERSAAQSPSSISQPPSTSRTIQRPNR